MSYSWIKKLNESNSKLHKEDVIKQAYEAAILGSENSQTFLNGLYYCYNNYLTYGVKQIPDTLAITDAENPWDEFFVLLNTLSNRGLTGNDARDAIQAMANRFNSDEWNHFLAPILRRDMRVGISEKTINKVVKKSKYEIPVFGCQLATNSEGRPELRGTKRLEPKLDGVRVLMFVSQLNKVIPLATSYSRNGKVFENFEHIEHEIMNMGKELVNASPHLLGDGFILDGEVVGKSFQELMRQARRKDNVSNEDSVFHVFDIIPIADFKRGIWETKLADRIAILDKMKPMIDQMKTVELLPHIMVDLDTEDGRKQMQEYAETMVDLGYEGILIKDLDAPYECDRTTAWLKWKPTITVDLTVIKIEEGTGRNKGRLGALVCHGIDGDREIEVNVGSGFSDQDRDELWADGDLVLGRTVEILADAVTQNQDQTYSLRFPRFVRFRDDK